jgi:hypothetical protein
MTGRDLECVVYEGEAAAGHLLRVLHLEEEQRLTRKQVVTQVHQRQVTTLNFRPQPKENFFCIFFMAG